MSETIIFSRSITSGLNINDIPWILEYLLGTPPRQSIYLFFFFSNEYIKRWQLKDEKFLQIFYIVLGLFFVFLIHPNLRKSILQQIKE